MIILYHGSDIEIDTIDLEKCKLGKDFGRGFYMTEDESKALRMAKRTALVNGTKPIVNKFTFADERTSELNVKIYDSISAEWAEFIYKNREIAGFKHDYDIVIGQTADDRLKRWLLEFRYGAMSFEELASNIEYHAVDKQYCFCTALSLMLLKKI